MKNSKEILSSVVKTAQMGQTGIRSVLDTSMRPSLRKALESQLREYDSIETEAHTIASQRGWELKELDPGARMMTDMMTRMKLHGRNTDSKIADMMIQGATMGVIDATKARNQYPDANAEAHGLASEYITHSQDALERMKQFLQ